MAHPGRIFTTVSSEELEHLRSENAELRRRIDEVGAEIDELRTESLQRRAEVRALVADLPTVVSRRSVVRQMFREGAHHPDKSGVLGRALRKLGRAPRKAFRLITRSK
jgi:predicted RNase H-like nuclease (RuvC/YqgF family)